jgi:hypothetical protein
MIVDKLYLFISYLIKLKMYFITTLTTIYKVIIL